MRGTIAESRRTTVDLAGLRFRTLAAVDSDKSDGIELPAQLGNCLPQHARAPSHEKATVVICSFDPAWIPDMRMDSLENHYES
jgi:hypothetical protein